MTEKIYELSWGWYEDSQHWILAGPSMMWEEFKSLCDSLISEAATKAVVAQQREDYPSYIGVSEVVEQMIPLLIERGFSVVETCRANYTGSGILKNGYGSLWEFLNTASAELIQTHNEQIRNKSYDDLENENV